MKKSISVLIPVVSAVVAIGGLSFGIKAANGKKAIEQEAQNLRKQLAERVAMKAQMETNATEHVAAKEDTPVTNSIVFLQSLVAQRDAEIERLQAARQESQPRESFSERMARMKEEEPERYAEMIQRRTERQEQLRYDQANRLTMFTDIDTSGMSEEELANHNILLGKLDALWNATGDFDPENPPDWNTIREAVGDFRELGQMMDVERSYMLQQLGADVGLSANDSTDFASYVNEIVNATTLRPPRGMRGGGNRNGGQQPAPAGSSPGTTDN